MQSSKIIKPLWEVKSIQFGPEVMQSTRVFTDYAMALAWAREMSATYDTGGFVCEPVGPRGWRVVCRSVGGSDCLRAERSV